MQLYQSSGTAPQPPVGTWTTVTSGNGGQVPASQGYFTATIVGGNYLTISATTALYGTVYTSVSPQINYTVGTLTLGAVTQATPTTVNIAYTTNYPTAATLSLYRSTTSTAQPPTGTWQLLTSQSATTSGSAFAGISNILNNDYLQIICTNYVPYGNIYSLVSSKWNYTVGTITLGSITQVTPSTVNVPFTTTGFPGGTTFTLYYSTSNSPHPAGTWSGTTFSASTSGSSTSASGTFSGVAIPSANYVEIGGTTTQLGTIYSGVSSQITYTTGSVTLSTQTQYSTSTKTVAFTCTGYPVGTTFTLYQNTSGATSYQTSTANWASVATFTTTVASSGLFGTSGSPVTIAANNYLQIVVTNTQYGNAYSAIVQCTYNTVTGLTLTQSTPSSVLVQWTNNGFIGSASTQIQQSVNGTTGWAQVGTNTNIGAGSTGIQAAITNNYYVRLQWTDPGTSSVYNTAASAQFSYTLGTISSTTQTQLTSTTKTIAFTTTNYPNGTTFTLYTQSGATAPASYPAGTWVQLGSTTTITGNAGSFIGVTIPATVSSNPNYYQIVGGTTVYGTSYSSVTQVTAYTSYSILLLHLDSSSTDSSTLNATMVAQGTPTYITTGKFGNAMFCGTTNANNNKNGFDTPQGAYYFGTNPFTIEFWFQTVANAGRMMGNCGSQNSANTDIIKWSAPSWVIGFYGTNRVGWETSTVLLTNPTSGGYVPTPSDGNLHHLAVCRNGANLYLYLDGVIAATSSSYSTWSDASGIYPNKGVISVGSSGNSNESFNGYIDEVRISTSALYPTTGAVGTVAFTVSTSAFSS
jgi:hypothetical protein